MKKQLRLLLITLFGTSMLMHAQHDTNKTNNTSGKKVYTLEQCIPGGKNYMDFYPQYLPQMQWLGNRYVYAKDDALLAGEQGTKKQEQTLITAAQLNELLPEAYKLRQTSYFPGFEALNRAEGVVAFNVPKGTVIVDLLQRHTLATYPKIAQVKAQDWAPDFKRRALVIDHNLYLQMPDQDSSALTRITTDGNEALVYGEAVHQREFGIDKGTFWSPDGSKLAFYRMDQSMVAPYPLVNVQARKAEEMPLRYPMAGMPSHHVTVGIYDVATGKTIYLNTGEPAEKYLTNLSWSSDAKTLYIAEINRGQNHFDLNAYDVSTGQRTKTLFSEDSKVYVEPQHPMVFVPGKKDQFIWQSRRDGWNHLYLYNTSGKLLKQVTKGPWEVTNFMGFDETNKALFFVSTNPSPLDRRLYRIGLDGKKMIDLTPAVGVHTPQLAPNKQYFIDHLQSPTVPRAYALCNARNGKEAFSIFRAPNPDEGYDMPEIETGTLTANDGKTPLYYKLVKPINMEPGKKYPVIIYVYGGPHAQMLTNTWHKGASGWDIYQAQHGYVIFTLDNRGSANRGAAFEQIIHRNLGEVEMQDQMTGVDYLKSLPFVDADRIGVHGWSYGGFMTTNLMLTHPDVFKVGVAGGPVIDWSKYEIMYGERYMDMPQENPEGYKRANLTLRAGDLKGHLLQIHGDIDNVVMMQHSLLFQKACIDHQTYPDYFIYPGHEHNVVGHGRVHLHEKINRYFRDYL